MGLNTSWGDTGRAKSLNYSFQDSNWFALAMCEHT